MAELQKGGPGGPPGPQRSRFEQVKLIIAVTIGVLIALFALLNLDKVEVNWIFTESETPLIVVIVVSFVLGAVTGPLLWSRFVRQDKHDKKV